MIWPETARDTRRVKRIEERNGERERESEVLCLECLKHWICQIAAVELISKINRQQKRV